MSAKIFAGAAALLSLVATQAAAQCGPPDEGQPAIRESLLVSTAWLSGHLRDSSLVILHVDHMSDGYARGHIPGARHVDAMAFTVDNFDLPSSAAIVAAAESLGIRPDSRVVIYGDPWVTGMVFVALDQIGHGDRTAMLDGGLEQWRAEGRPVTTQLPAPMRVRYVPHAREVAVDAAWVNAHLRDDRAVVIDARTMEEYAGTGRDHGQGHIPGARLLAWSTLFERPADVEHSKGAPLKSPYALRALFRGAGVHGDLTPVVYCTVGMRASQMYFVLRYLGYHPKFYDGSMSDWSRRSELPVVTGPNRGTP